MIAEWLFYWINNSSICRRFMTIKKIKMLRPVKLINIMPFEHNSHEYRKYGDISNYNETSVQRVWKFKQLTSNYSNYLKLYQNGTDFQYNFNISKYCVLNSTSHLSFNNKHIFHLNFWNSFEIKCRHSKLKSTYFYSFSHPSINSECTKTVFNLSNVFNE